MLSGVGQVPDGVFLSLAYIPLLVTEGVLTVIVQ